MLFVLKVDGERMVKDFGVVKYVECSVFMQYKLKDVFDEVGDGRVFVLEKKKGKKKLIIIVLGYCCCFRIIYI